MFCSPASRPGRARFPNSPTIYTAHQGSPFVTIPDAATIVWDLQRAQKGKVTIGATGRTMTFVNGVDGFTYWLLVLQDGTGSRTITTWTNFDYGTAGTQTLTTTASKGDLLAFEGITIAGTFKLRYCGIQKGYT